MRSFELWEQDVRFSLRLRHSDAWLQTADHRKGISPVSNYIHDGRNIQVYSQPRRKYRTKIEAGWHHAHHDDGCLIQYDCLPDNIRIAGKLALPERIAQQRSGSAALLTRSEERRVGKECRSRW